MIPGSTTISHSLHDITGKRPLHTFVFDFPNFSWTRISTPRSPRLIVPSIFYDVSKVVRLVVLFARRIVLGRVKLLDLAGFMTDYALRLDLCHVMTDFFGTLVLVMGRGHGIYASWARRMHRTDAMRRTRHWNGRTWDSLSAGAATSWGWGERWMRGHESVLGHRGYEYEAYLIPLGREGNVFVLGSIDLAPGTWGYGTPNWKVGYKLNRANLSLSFHLLSVPCNYKYFPAKGALHAYEG
jgi:hypothetical protein